MHRTLATAAFLTALAGPAFADDAVVSIELWNNDEGKHGITLSADSLKAGQVVFNVVNKSKDMTHELLWVKTELPESAFPFTAAGVKVDESKLDGVEEFGDLDPGKAGETKVTLSPGRYVLFCNEDGHYKAGMHKVLVVK